MTITCANCSKCKRARAFLKALPRSSQNRGEPRATDVILGRGRRLEAREGNQAFVKLTGEFLDMYKAAVTRKDKKNVTIQVVQTALQKGIRFLRQNSAKQYEETDNETVRVRVGQSLRYMMKQNNHTREHSDSSGQSSCDSNDESSVGNPLDPLEPDANFSMDFDLKELLKYNNVEDENDFTASESQSAATDTVVAAQPLSNTALYNRPESPADSSSSYMSWSDSDIETIAASLLGGNDDDDIAMDGIDFSDLVSDDNVDFATTDHRTSPYAPLPMEEQRAAV